MIEFEELKEDFIEEMFFGEDEVKFTKEMIEEIPDYDRFNG